MIIVKFKVEAYQHFIPTLEFIFILSFHHFQKPLGILKIWKPQVKWYVEIKEGLDKGRG